MNFLYIHIIFIAFIKLSSSIKDFYEKIWQITFNNLSYEEMKNLHRETIEKLFKKLKNNYMKNNSAKIINFDKYSYNIFFLSDQVFEFKKIVNTK